MSVVAFIKRLREKGWSWDQAMEAAEAFEAETPALERDLTPRQERNRRYYENRRLKTSEIKTLKTDQDVSDASKTPPAPSCTQVETLTSSLRSEDKPPTHPSGASPRKAKLRLTRRCPDEWAPSEITQARLVSEGYSPGQLERALTMIRDHEFPKARSDWDAAYRNWVRRDSPLAKNPHERSHPDAKFAARQANLATHERGADLAARLHGKP